MCLCACVRVCVCVCVSVLGEGGGLSLKSIKCFPLVTNPQVKADHCEISIFPFFFFLHNFM